MCGVVVGGVEEVEECVGEECVVFGVGKGCVVEVRGWWGLEVCG